MIDDDKRKAHLEKLDAQLKEWNTQLSLLKAKADKTRAEAKSEYYKIIEELRNKVDDARPKLQELKAAGDEAWEDLKSGAEKAWADIRTALDKAVSKFK